MNEPAAGAGGEIHGLDGSSARETALWEAADGMLGGASLGGILAHRLGPLAGKRFRALGRQVPKELREEERAAALAMMSAGPLIERIRSATDLPLVVIKGPVLAKLYPAQARRFIDVDVLTTDADSVQRSLLGDGFVEDPDPGQDLTDEHHHLQPIRWPALPLKVEVHARPALPTRARRVPFEEILEASVPADLGVEGILAPSPQHHALILASHAWLHTPLATLRDMIDIAAVSAQANESELARTATAWGVDRLWRTTRNAIDGLFYDGPRSVPLRTWARHLEGVRERTVLEAHLQRWLDPFWELPLHAALAVLPRVLRAEVAPAPGDTGRDKLRRMVRAIRAPRASAPRGARGAGPPAGKRDAEPPLR